MIKIIKNSINKGILSRALAPEDMEKIGTELKDEISRRFKRSFHIREVDTGSCGACDSEIAAMTNPIYDIQRFGVDFVATPRHADALLVTGALSKNMEFAFMETYNAMPGPKYVITVGDCMHNGGVFSDSYYICRKISELVPVSLHIPGCPPKPLDIMRAILYLLKG